MRAVHRESARQTGNNLGYRFVHFVASVSGMFTVLPATTLSLYRDTYRKRRNLTEDSVRISKIGGGSSLWS